jgi:membrane-associated phospholipid phosphatase
VDQRARRAAVGAVACLAALCAVNFVAFHTWTGERVDASVLNGFSALGTHARVSRLASLFANLCDPNPYVLFCTIPLAIALIRRRLDLAVTIAVILLGANETTHVLKPLLDQHRPRQLIDFRAPGSGSWPSGHATASMALALSTVLAVPARLRAGAAACGAAFAIGVTYAFLALGWHYPSDAIGGFLVATTWTFAGVAGLSRHQARAARALWADEPAARSPWADGLPTLLTAAGAVALVALVVVLSHPATFVAYTRTHAHLFAGIAVVGTSAAALSSAVLLALRRPGRDSR